MAARQDLSDNLDILGIAPGTVLVRGPDFWSGAAPSEPGQVLMSGEANEAPHWQTIGSSGGAWTQIEDVILSAGLGVNVQRQVTLPAGWYQLDILLFVPVTGGNKRPELLMNGVASADHNTNMWSMGDGQGFQSQEFYNQTGCRIYTYNDGPYAGDYTAHIRAARYPNGNNVALLGQCHVLVPNYQTSFTCYWDNNAGLPITKIGFTSTQSNGLPAGTRITVLAMVI